MRSLTDEDLEILALYFDTKILRRLDRIEGLLARTGGIIMADLTQLTADVAADTDAVSSAVTLINSLAQQIRDAGTDPAALATLADTLEANTASLAAAVTANTAAAPPADGSTPPADGSTPPA